MSPSSDFSALEGKTVLQVLPALGIGGVERGTIEISEALAAEGARGLVASAPGGMADGLGDRHVPLPLATKNPIRVWRNMRRLAGIVAEEGVDLIHARSRAPAWSAWGAATGTGVRFVTTVHGLYGAGSAAKRAYNRVMTRGERVIAVSNHVAEHVGRVYACPAERIRVVHRGVDGTLFDPASVGPGRVAALRTAWDVPESACVVLLPARLTRWKGQLVLIGAMRELARAGRISECVAVLAGPDPGRGGYRRELEDAAAGLPVRVVGPVDDMAAAYAASAVVVSPSTDPEAFGRTIAEAGAMGRPCVASAHGGAREIVVDGVTGRLVPPGDPEALAGGIAWALGNAGPALAAAARGHVLRNFTRERMRRETLAVYAELLGGFGNRT